MESVNLLPLLEQLDDEIDDLEDSLAPLLQNSLTSTASKLPLLDKAKLFILMTYAIESIIFCKLSILLSYLYSILIERATAYLRLNGVKAREHPVFKELTRVKLYFEKVKMAEHPVGQNKLRVDKEAAARFIKAGLVYHVLHSLL